MNGFSCERGCRSAGDCEIAAQLTTQAGNLRGSALAVNPDTAMQYAQRAEDFIGDICGAKETAMTALAHYRRTAAETAGQPQK